MVGTVGRNAFQFSRDSRRFHFSHASTDYFDTLSISLAWLGGSFCRISTIPFFFLFSLHRDESNEIRIGWALFVSWNYWNRISMRLRIKYLFKYTMKTLSVLLLLLLLLLLFILSHYACTLYPSIIVLNVDNVINIT